MRLTELKPCTPFVRSEFVSLAQSLAMVGVVDLAFHYVWHRSFFHFFEQLLLLTGVFVLNHFDYYAMRSKMQPDLRITPDRDETTESCKPIDNRS